MTDNRLTTEELDALTALEKTATAKPWRQHAADSGLVIGLVSEASQHITAVAEVYSDLDMQFLLAFRNAAPRLISSARALAEAERRIAELEAGLKPFAKVAAWNLVGTVFERDDSDKTDWLYYAKNGESVKIGDFRRAARLLNGETK